MLTSGAPRPQKPSLVGLVGGRDRLRQRQAALWMYRVRTVHSNWTNHTFLTISALCPCGCVVCCVLCVVSPVTNWHTFSEIAKSQTFPDNSALACRWIPKCAESGRVKSRVGYGESEGWGAVRLTLDSHTEGSWPPSWADEWRRMGWLPTAFGTSD
jgi:hypothetical protein